MSTLTAALSGTPLEKELAAIQAGLERIPRTDARFDASAWDPKSIATLRAQWEFRMMVEHRSSMVFSQLAQQLFEANASLDAKIVMMRMAQDELRHTGTCAEVITALGGKAEVEASLTVEPLARHGNASPEERALRNVIYTTCMSEMIACARFVATLDRTTDPYMRDAMRRLLSDEILHGQFGFHYLAAWRPWLDAHPDVKASVERYLVHAFAVFETELAPQGTFAPLSSEEMQLGGDDPALAREVFYGTVEHAIVPGLENQGLAAGIAWRERRRLA
jgi:hypothetical protein